MKIFVANSAYSDLEDIKEYYIKEGVAHIGKQFIEAIIEHVQILADNPDIGRVVPEFGEEQIRELIHSPFRVVYLKEPNSIHIIRVWRSERMLRLADERKT
ncbi:MAG: type II toxin-antitoxin system RelE/ParE family toxin [Gammaproteobacteria bacterium]|nr:type II toxin-antitoxin system RelE/ParE family toxin [Gammaproteobacteria bacterium]MBT4606903.1 type II toxin-antitoxin system RelE/ParE family toxin [Thiotrichales bacterium]MBT5465303.1 type II toxin-antitoxin system RelE/ParE family toxin [Candidatus Neomarinimicrobiota bacterium]MBT3718164.1 type II toxin-antitoxin system RelE/ParE family toxin [Gammaproteobacteria bacterium]MBT4079036.1 type II toxin-antitoxin system RelE/ParE family toxin [Gammaproteobacteria bacterium]